MSSLKNICALQAELYRHRGAPRQLTGVIEKMSQTTDLVKQLDWHSAYVEKEQESLGLNELRPDLFN